MQNSIKVVNWNNLIMLKIFIKPAKIQDYKNHKPLHKLSKFSSQLINLVQAIKRPTFPRDLFLATVNLLGKIIHIEVICKIILRRWRSFNILIWFHGNIHSLIVTNFYYQFFFITFYFLLLSCVIATE